MRRSIQCLLSLALSIGAFAAVAADAPAATETPTKLEISLVVTAKGRELFESWERPTGKPFHIEPVKVAVRGRLLSAVVLFKGCRPDAGGNCNVEVDFTAYDPKGGVYGEMKRAELWQAKPAPRPGHTQLGVDYMGIVIEPQDVVGTYRVTAVARDRNAGSEVKSSGSFEVR